MIAVLVVLAFACVRALRFKSPVDYGYVGLAAVVVCLAPNAVVEFSTALRNTAFLLLQCLLVPNSSSHPTPALRPSR